MVDRSCELTNKKTFFHLKKNIKSIALRFLMIIVHLILGSFQSFFKKGIHIYEFNNDFTLLVIGE